MRFGRGTVVETVGRQRADTAASDDDDFDRRRVEHVGKGVAQPFGVARTRLGEKNRRDGAPLGTDDAPNPRGRGLLYHYRVAFADLPDDGVGLTSRRRPTRF